MGNVCVTEYPDIHENMDYLDTVQNYSKSPPDPEMTTGSDQSTDTSETEEQDSIDDQEFSNRMTMIRNSIGFDEKGANDSGSSDDLYDSFGLL